MKGLKKLVIESRYWEIKMPNGKPDPNCSECKGKGQITLLISSSVCNCIDSKPVLLKYPLNEMDALSQFEKYIFKDHPNKKILKRNIN